MRIFHGTLATILLLAGSNPSLADSTIDYTLRKPTSPMR